MSLHQGTGALGLSAPCGWFPTLEHQKSAGSYEFPNKMRQLTKHDPEIKQAVVGICSVVNDNPYDRGICEWWRGSAR